jgi:isoquinoline 1-oxidoreductase beta subunit
MLLELIGPPRIEDPRPQMAPGIYAVGAYYNAPYESFPIDAGRIRGVLELAAEKAGWGRNLPPRHGMGIAVHRERANTCVATVVEVAVADDGSFTVPRVDTAIDCGFHVNPERIMSQCEGAAIMGLSLAKYGMITFKDGRVQQSNYYDYPLIRINEAPIVTNVYIVPQPYEVHASGVGEPPLPPFARRYAMRSLPPLGSASAACRSAHTSPSDLSGHRHRARRGAGLSAPSQNSR